MNIMSLAPPIAARAQYRPRSVTAPAFSPASRERRPASQSPTRSAAATSTPYVCRNERPNISGYIYHLLLGPQQIDQQQAAANHDRRIRHVKRVPVMLADVEVQKIRHPAPHRAIEHIARRPAHNQREADRKS